MTTCTLTSETLDRLVHEVADGDPKALQSLVEHFRPYVWSTAARRGLSRMDIEDVLQETWLQLLLHAGRIRQPECLAGWLRRTTINACNSRNRQRRRNQLAGSDTDRGADSGPADPCGDAVTKRIEQDVLGRAVSRLCERDQVLVKLIAFRTSYREISDTLGIPLGSIGPTRERILAKLAHCAEVRQLAA